MALLGNKEALLHLACVPTPGGRREDAIKVSSSPALGSTLGSRQTPTPVTQASFPNPMKGPVCAAPLLGAGVNGIGRGLAPLARQRTVCCPPVHLRA